MEVCDHGIRNALQTPLHGGFRFQVHASTLASRPTSNVQAFAGDVRGRPLIIAHMRGNRTRLFCRARIPVTI